MFVIDIPSLHADDLKQQPDTGPPIKAVPGYSSTTTNQHVLLLMSSTEGTPPHCAPTPTSLYN